jgi:eukaryotic-like serine/threonine-protein kinase
VSANSERLLSSAERMRAEAPLTIGQVVAARYRIERVVGVGGMGFVYEATNQSTGERVAIKCLLRSLATDAECVTRFLREARSTASIQSAHVVRVFEAGQEPSVPPYFVMEFLEGEDLGAVVEDSGPLPVDEAVAAVIQACLGVGDAHALGLVHRDLKPSNLIRTSSGIKVVDFGISKVLLEAEGGDRLTQTTAVFGSPAYMSPEQVRSAKHVDARTDVWALGVVLYELLSGKAPFAGDNSGAVLAAIIADEATPLRTMAPHVPEGLEQVVHACLVKDRERRVRSVAELAQRLAPFALGQGGLLQRVRLLSAKWEESGRPAFDASRTEPTLSVDSRRRRVPKALLGIFSGVAAVAIGAFAALFPRSRVEPPATPVAAIEVADRRDSLGSAALLPLQSQAAPLATVSATSTIAVSSTAGGSASAPGAPHTDVLASAKAMATPQFAKPAVRPVGLPAGVSDRRK